MLRDPRAIEFLKESSAIEGILNIPYDQPVLQSADKGHYGALSRVARLAADHGHGGDAALTIEEICEWQRLITQEQVGYGHALPPEGIGRLRSPDVPVNVRVGDHVPPGFAEVPGKVAAWLDALNAALSPDRVSEASDSEFVACLGDYFQRFEAIHPFVDGNGRTGRLVASYIALVHRQPLIVFRASERPSYYSAHKSKLAMRLFMAEKIRERAVLLSGEIADRELAGSSDVYRTPTGETLIIERHELLRAQAEWMRQESHHA